MKRTNSIFKNAAWLTVTKFVTLAINMVVTMLLSRYRTLGEYGVFSQITLVTNLASSLFMLGLPGSVNYFLNKSENNKTKNEFLSSYFLLGTAMSVVLGAVLFACSGLIVRYFNNPAIYTYMFVMVLLPWISIFNTSADNIFIAYENISALTIYRIAYSCALMGVAVIFSWSELSFINYMRAYISVQVLFCLLLYIIVQKISGRFSFKLNKRLLKEILLFSIPLGLASVVSTLNIELDKLMLGALLSTEELAVYSNASKELPINIICVSISSVLMPQMVRLLKENKFSLAIDIWKKTVSVSYIIICFFCTAIFVFAPQVITILYSEKYLAGVTVFRIYSLTTLFKVTYFGIVLNSMGKTKKIFSCSVLTLVLNVILNFILYKIMGVIGPAIATLISTFTIVLLQLLMTSSLVKISIKNIFPWKNLFLLSMINVGFGLIAYVVFRHIILHTNVNDILACIFVGVVWVLIYGITFVGRVVSLRGGIVEKED